MSKPKYKPLSASAGASDEALLDLTGDDLHRNPSYRVATGGDRDAGLRHTVQRPGTGDSGVVIKQPKKTPDPRVIQEMLLQQRWKSVVATPPDPSLTDALALARLSNTIYDTQSTNKWLRITEKKSDPEHCFLTEKHLKDIAFFWPKRTTAGFETIPQVLPSRDAFRRWEQGLPLGHPKEDYTFEAWSKTEKDTIITEGLLKEFRAAAKFYLSGATLDHGFPVLNHKKKDTITNEEGLEKIRTDAKAYLHSGATLDHDGFPVFKKAGKEEDEEWRLPQKWLDSIKFLESYPDFKFVASSENKAGLQSKIAVSKSTRKVFVIFRGTSGVTDMCADLLLCTKPVTPDMSHTEFSTSSTSISCCHPCGGCFDTPQVHLGFLTQLMDTEFADSRYDKDEGDNVYEPPTGQDWESRFRTGSDSSMTALLRHVNREIKSLQDDVLDEKGAAVDALDDVRLLITGHSLGGAVATVFAHQVASQRTDIPINVVTFGSPRVGTRSFARSFNAKHSIKYLRVQQGCDVVTQLPYCCYTHVGDHLWIVPGWVTDVECLQTPVIANKTTANKKKLIFETPPEFQRKCCYSCCEPLWSFLCSDVPGDVKFGSDVPGDEHELADGTTVLKGGDGPLSVLYDPESFDVIGRWNSDDNTLIKVKFHRTFAGPYAVPPLAARLPCLLGACLGPCFVGTFCGNDHSMAGYVNSLKTAEHQARDKSGFQHDFWYTQKTTRDQKIYDKAQKTLAETKKR